MIRVLNKLHYYLKHQLFPFFLACGFPKSFSLKDNDGHYLCLSDDGHLHVNENEKYCPSNFQSSNRHKFDVVTNADDSVIPPKMCAIRSSYDNSYLQLDDKYLLTDKADVANTLVGNAKYFFASDSGSGKVTIFNFQAEKYLVKDGYHIRATTNVDCGNDCHFILENLSSATTATPTNTGVIFPSLSTPTGLLIKKTNINHVYVKHYSQLNVKTCLYHNLTYIGSIWKKVRDNTFKSCDDTYVPGYGKKGKESSLSTLDQCKVACEDDVQCAFIFYKPERTKCHLYTQCAVTMKTENPGIVMELVTSGMFVFMALKSNFNNFNKFRSTFMK